MASNTVEATLRSKFEDGVTRAFQATEQMLGQAMGNIKNAGATAAAGFNAAFGSILGGLESYRQQLKQSAEESDSTFGKISLGAAAMTLAVVAAFLKAGKAAADFLISLAKESSQALEVRTAFESLTQAMGAQADVVLGKLKQATEGQISNTILMQNANRVMQSGVQISNETYAKLTENVFRLAKASGVDGAQAMNTLTDAIIRGNARGLQAIGLHLAVKDAVSAMAEATGSSTGRLADAGRMQAFYAELVGKTNEAVAGLGPKIITAEDALRQGETTWRGFLTNLGVAIGRSGTLQGLLEIVSQKLLATGPGKDQLDQLTLSTNRFVISFLTGMANVASTLSATLEVLNVFWATAKVAFAAGSSAVILAVGAVLTVLEKVSLVLSKVPGAPDAWKRSYNEIAEANQTLRGALSSNMQDILHPWDSSLSRTAGKLDEFAMAAAGVAGTLSVTTGQIIRGAAANKDHADAAGDAAAQQQKLNEQLLKYSEIRQGLLGRAGLGGEAAMQQLFSDWGKIDQELTLKGAEWDAKRNELKTLAVQAYFAKVNELQAKQNEQQQKLIDEGDKIAAESEKNRQQQMLDNRQALFLVLTNGAEANEQHFNEVVEAGERQREEIRKKEVGDALSAANAIERALDLAGKGKISADTGIETLNHLPDTMAALQKQLDILRAKPILTEVQVNEVVRLQEALDKLNRLKWTPFQKALDDMKQQLKQFAAQGVQAFADFFSALVQGQEGAGQKLLAAFIGMIGQMLVHVGVILVQTGIAEIAMAQTLVGRLMGASVAGGLKAIAAGAIIAALGGVMEGAAANLSQASQSSASTAAPAAGQSATNSSSQVQVINVGTPYGPQNPGQASSQAEEHQVVQLQIQPPKGWVVKEVVGAVRGNNRRVRVAIQNA